jgi:predicted MFS family arabinose efflux permease
MQEAVRLSLDLSDNQIALIQGPALALPYVILSVPLGLVIDCRSRVRVIAGIAFCNLLGTTLTALAPSFAWLLAARCLVGVAATLIGPVSFSLLADLFAPAQRGRAATIIMPVRC